MPSSSWRICSSFAPFCRAKTYAAPCGPQNGFCTSQATMNVASFSAGCRWLRSMCAICSMIFPPCSNSFPCLSYRCAPSACIMPMPASFVALPPMPIMNRRNPFSNASFISSPVPYVLVFIGFRSIGERVVSPFISAISMIAVRWSPNMPYRAGRIRIKGSWAWVDTNVP